MKQLKKILNESPNVFDGIVDPIRNEVDSTALINKKELAELTVKIDNFTDADIQCDYGIDHYIETQHDLMATEAELEYLSQRNLVLREMQVLYTYKNLEITLKALISTVYPNEVLDGLHNWDKLKVVTKNKGANITQCSNFLQIDLLRRVCNSLKHSSKISSKVKEAQIKEFKGKDFFCDQSLGKFFDRVEPLISDFYVSFCALLIESVGGCKEVWLKSFEPYVNPDPEIPF